MFGCVHCALMFLDVSSKDCVQQGCCTCNEQVCARNGFRYCCCLAPVLLLSYVVHQLHSALKTLQQLTPVAYFVCDLCNTVCVRAPFQHGTSAMCLSVSCSLVSSTVVTRPRHTKVAMPSVPGEVVCVTPSGSCSYLLGAWHRQCCGAVIFRCGSGSQESSLQRSPIPSIQSHPRPHRGSDGVQEPLLGAGCVGESHSVAFADGVSTGECSTCPLI